MVQIEDYKQASSDFAVVQSGSLGVSRAGIVLGARSGQPSLHLWNDLRFAFSTGRDNFGIFEDFLGDIGGSSAPAGWTEDADSTGTVLPSATPGAEGGQVVFTTPATADDHITLSLGTHWNIANGWLFFEHYVQLGQLADTIWEGGLSDALSETNGLAFSDHSVAGITAVADDALAFAYDSDVNGNWHVNTVNDGGTPQAFDTGIAATTDFVQLSIRVSPTGTAYFYIDGVLVQEVEDAVNSVALTPWLSLTALAASAVTANVDYVGVTGGRG